MLELVQTPTTVLHVLVCLFLVLVILIQPGKSGGLGAALGGAGAQQVFGGRGAGTFLSKVTWGCAVTFFLTSMTLAYMSSSGDDTLRDRAEAKAQAAAEVESAPAAVGSAGSPGTVSGVGTVDAVDLVPAPPAPEAPPSGSP